MREILYRGKRKDTGELIVSGSIWQGNGAIKLWDEKDGWVDVESETIGQYTELTDKNGKKIFEGDIMRLCSATHPCIVYWDGMGWAWRMNGKRREIDLTRERMEVIGNIHDNPKLAEGRRWK